MVKKRDLERCKRELSLLSEFMGVPLFVYDEVHKDMPTQNSNYDYNHVIDDYTRYFEGVLPNGVSADAWTQARNQSKQKLIDMGVLIEMADNEYVVKFDDEVKFNKKAQAKNGCIYVNSIADADFKDVQGFYQKFAEEYAKKNDVFSDKELAAVYTQFGQDVGQEKNQDVKDYKEYLEKGFGAAYAYAHALATVGKGSMKFAKKSGMGELVEGCNDDILKEINRVVNDARRDGTWKGYAVSGWRWLKEKVTGEEVKGIEVSHDELFDANGNVKLDQLQKITAKIVKEKALSPTLYKSDLTFYKQQRIEKEEARANSSFWRTIDFVKEKTDAFKKWKNRNVLFSKDARMDRRVQRKTKNILKRKIKETDEHKKAVAGMEKIALGMQLLQAQGMDPLSGELLKLMIKDNIKAGNSFDKESRQDFVNKFIEAQTRMGKEPVKKSDLNRYLKYVEKAVAANEDNPVFDKLVSYCDRPYSEVKKAMNTALNDPENFVSAEYVPSKYVTPLMGASVEQTIVFINAGLDVTKQDEHGKTALHYATNPDVAELLCAANPDIVHIKDNLGRTAAHYATGAKMVDVLSAYGADFNVQDNKGCTPLHLIDDKETVAALCEVGADVKILDNEGHTALQSHLNSGKIEAISGYFDKNFSQDEKYSYFNYRKDASDLSAIEMVVTNKDYSTVEKKNMINAFDYTNVIDPRGMFNKLSNADEIKLIFDWCQPQLENNALQELLNDAFTDASKTTPAKIEAIANVCEQGGLDKNVVFNFKDEEGKTPLVHVFESSIPNEQKVKLAQMMVHNGADFEYAKEFVEKRNEEEKQKKEEQEKAAREQAEKDKAEKDKAEKDKAEKDKAEKDKAEKNKTEKDKAAGDKQEEPQDKKDKPENRANLGEIFVAHPELSSLYTQLIAGCKTDQIKAVNKAFESVAQNTAEGSGKVTSMEDKIFTSLLSSKEFSEQDKSAILDKLIKAESRRVGAELLPDGTRVTCYGKNQENSETLKFTYKDGSSIEFSKKDNTVTKKYKDAKGREKTIKLEGAKAEKLVQDLMKVKGLSGQAKQLPKLFSEAQKAQNTKESGNSAMFVQAFNRVKTNIGH